MGRRKAGDNPNAKLCELLSVIADYEKLVTKSSYKYNTYKQAIQVLANHPVKIKSGAEAQELGKIGSSIAELIDEYISTGKIERVEEIEQDEDFQAILELTQVSGIGPSKARDLVQQGVKTIEDLKACTDSLNHHQLIGLKYFDDFQLKIPRGEIEAIERLLIEAVAKVDGRFIVTICGSYRLGKPSCCDVDCLVTHPNYPSDSSDDDDDDDGDGDGDEEQQEEEEDEGEDENEDEDEEEEEEEEINLRKIVAQLKCTGLVIDTIALGPTKFMGVCQLNSRKPARRLDLRLIPNDLYPFALLYFTGSDLFIKEIKAHALSQGYSLDEYSLRPVDSSGDLGKPLSMKSERQIFECLNYPYKSPQERDL